MAEEEDCKAELLQRLNAEYESVLMDFVEMWADQRDTEVCQRLHAARATGFGPNWLDVSCIYHKWEEQESTDVFFEHRATVERSVRVPLPFPVATHQDCWRAFEQMREQTKTRTPDLI